MNLLKCVNFSTYLRRSIHTQTRCLSAQCVLCDGLHNGVAAILGNHRAADSRQHVFSISPLPVGSTCKFNLFGQFPKSLGHYFTGATQEALFLEFLPVYLCGLSPTTVNIANTSSEHETSPSCTAPYNRAKRLGFAIVNT